jgi:hypothetical protein
MLCTPHVVTSLHVCNSSQEDEDYIIYLAESEFETVAWKEAKVAKAERVLADLMEVVAFSMMQVMPAPTPRVVHPTCVLVYTCVTCFRKLRIFLCS